MQSNIAILVVEDDFTTRSSMFTALSSLGYEKIFTAKNSQKAMEIVAKEDIDLALLDVGLVQSDLDGISLAKSIKNRCPDTKLIFTTSFSDKTTLDRSSEVDHQNFLIKPVGNEQLSVSIQKAFSEENSIRQVLTPNQCPFSVLTDHVYIKSKNDKYYYKVRIQDILYLETTNKGVEFFTHSEKFFNSILLLPSPFLN
ncbi:MAG: response regulator [Saprospiraceae bacterium]